MMVETRPVGPGLWCFVCLVWCWVSLFLSPPSDCSSLPSTMTWAPCPHGVRTRGKKIRTSLRSCEQSAKARLLMYNKAGGVCRTSSELHFMKASRPMRLSVLDSLRHCNWVQPAKAFPTIS